MNEGKLLTEQGRLFGFRMPGCDPAQVLEIAKKSVYKKVRDQPLRVIANFNIGGHETIAGIPTVRSCGI